MMPDISRGLCLGSRTPAVSRRATDDGLVAQTAIGAVGSSALFGPTCPRPLARTCPLTRCPPQTRRHAPHDLRPGHHTHGVHLAHRRHGQAPAPARCCTARQTPTRRPTRARAVHGRVGRRGPTRHHGRGTPPQAHLRRATLHRLAARPPLSQAGRLRTTATACRAPGRLPPGTPRCGGTVPPDTVWRPRPRAGRPRRQHPTPRRRTQVSSMRHGVWQADPHPSTTPDETTGGAVVWRTQDRQPPHGGPGSTRTRQDETARTAARAGPTGSHTPRRPRVTRETPDTGHLCVPAPPACHRPPPRRAERHASGAAESGSEARADAGSRRLHALVRQGLT